MEGTDIVRCGVINSDLFYSKPEESDVQSGLCQPRLVQLELRKLLAESVNIVVVVGSTTTASFGSTLGRRFLLASCLLDDRRVHLVERGIAELDRPVGQLVRVLGARARSRERLTRRECRGGCTELLHFQCTWS